MSVTSSVGWMWLCLWHASLVAWLLDNSIGQLVLLDQSKCQVNMLAKKRHNQRQANWQKGANGQKGLIDH